MSVMPWKRPLGLFFLFLALVLVFLLTVKMPAVDTRQFPITNPVEVPYGPNNFYNITIEPLNKTDYHLDVWISPYGDQTMMIDFWAVNKTGFDLLDMSLAYSQLRPNYPNERPFNYVTAHAKEINITYSKQIELTNLNHNGIYCLVAVNFFENTQNISVTVEEKYAAAPRPLLEPNPPSIIFTIAVAILGVYLVIASRKRSSRRAKTISIIAQPQNTSRSRTILLRQDIQRHKVNSYQKHSRNDQNQPNKRKAFGLPSISSQDFRRPNNLIARDRSSGSSQKRSLLARTVYAS